MELRTDMSDVTRTKYRRFQLHVYSSELSLVNDIYSTFWYITIPCMRFLSDLRKRTHKWRVESYTASVTYFFGNKYVLGLTELLCLKK